MRVADRNREKFTENQLFFGFNVVQGHQCWYPRKARESACYDKQQVCVYLQPFSC